MFHCNLLFKWSNVCSSVCLNIMEQSHQSCSFIYELLLDIYLLAFKFSLYSIKTLFSSLFLQFFFIISFYIINYSVKMSSIKLMCSFRFENSSTIQFLFTKYRFILHSSWMDYLWVTGSVSYFIIHMIQLNLIFSSSLMYIISL